MTCFIQFHLRQVVILNKILLPFLFKVARKKIVISFTIFKLLRQKEANRIIIFIRAFVLIEMIIQNI